MVSLFESDRIDSHTVKSEWQILFPLGQKRSDRRDSRRDSRKSSSVFDTLVEFEESGSELSYINLKCVEIGCLGNWVGTDMEEDDWGEEGDWEEEEWEEEGWEEEEW